MLPSAVQRHRALMAQQLSGAEALQGTYPFTLERSVKAYRLNRFLHGLVQPAYRERFLADEAAFMRGAGLTETERELVDWERAVSPTA